MIGLVTDRPRRVVPRAAMMLIWAATCLGLAGLFWRDVAALHLGDPDDAMRLVQVRDLLAGQGWFDLHQYRLEAPAGTLMHWSRLVDVPIAAIILLLRPVLGMAAAEAGALLIVPALTLLCALALAMRLCARTFDRHTAIVGGILMALSGPVLHQMRPLRIDHHGWQLVMTLAVLNAIAVRDPRKGGWAAGLALAVWLTISLEGLPLAALFIAVLALRGLGRRGDWRWLLHGTAALCAGATGLFLLTRGLSDVAQHCDQISPMHLAIFAAGAAGSAAIAASRPASTGGALGMLAVLAAVSAAMVAAIAPQCTRGAFGDLDPWVARVWLGNITEGLPIWRTQPATIASLVSFVPIGIYGTWNLWRRAPDAEARRWAEHALLLAGATVIGVLVARAMTTACTIALLPAAWQVRQWRLAALRAPPPRRLAIDLGLAATVLPVIPVMVVTATVASARQDAAAPPPKGCRLPEAFAALARLPATQVFAPVDIGPELLRRTPHSVVATSHHRAQAGIRDAMRAFSSPPEKARAIIHRRHATLIVVCTTAPEMGIYRAMNPHSLGAMLAGGTAPAWLRPLDIAPADTNVRFWTVIG